VTKRSGSDDDETPEAHRWERQRSPHLTKGRPMHHHPDLILRNAQEIQRSKIHAAECRRLARSVRNPRRSFLAQRV